MDQDAGSAKGCFHHGFYKSVTDECVRYANRWVYWETQTTREGTKGKGDYLTMRELAEKSGRANKIDDYSVSWAGREYVDVFWNARRGIDNKTPISPRILADYCNDSGVLLDRHERDIIYRMDSAFRSAMEARRAENEKALMAKAKNG